MVWFDWQLLLPPAVCGPWRWACAGECRSAHSSPEGQSPGASCVASPPPRSSGAEEHEGTSATDESARPSAPAWTDRNQRNGVDGNRGRWRYVSTTREKEIAIIGYLAYVGVMTKMVGWEGLAACFWGCLVTSDFLICSWRRCISPRSRDMVRSLGMSCSVQSQRWPDTTDKRLKYQSSTGVSCLYSLGTKMLLFGDDCFVL